MKMQYNQSLSHWLTFLYISKFSENWHKVVLVTLFHDIYDGDKTLKKQFWITFTIFAIFESELSKFSLRFGPEKNGENGLAA